MDKVKAGLRGLNALQKATKAAIVYQQMNGNPDFPAPDPSMAEFHAAYLELKAANLAALDRGRMAMHRRNMAVERMDHLLTRLAAYVNSVCLGDRLKLESSGFKLVKKPSPISSLEVPGDLTVRRTAYENVFNVRWNSVKGALMYEVEVKPDGSPNWERVTLTGRTSVRVKDELAQPFVQFRVCAIGRQTTSPWTAPKFLNAETLPVS